MNRIICDICGSEYPETDERCPICNYPRQGTEKLAAAAAVAERAQVKGGRFSSKNVKKRRKAQLRQAKKEEGGKDPNKPLWIVIILLLVAILLVSVYIGTRFFMGRQAYQDETRTTTAPTTVPTLPPTVPCSDITLNSPVLDLEEMGSQKQIELRLLPVGTTDAAAYSSADPNVATVSETGLVTAVGPGQTQITITCGAVTEVCTVVCWFQPVTTVPPATTQPVETAPPPTEAPVVTEPAELTLDPNDASCFTKGESFTIYVRLGSRSVGRSKVTWKTSDPKVATVENGVVTAVGKGTAAITAEYDGQKAICMVRCRFEEEEAPVETKPSEEPKPTEETKSPEWKASHSDVSIAVGESFRLRVTNAEGKKADAIWTMSMEGVVSIDGSTVTGRAPGTVTLKTTVDGVTLTCIVRVK